MKKTILFLYPDKFTHFEYCKYELLQLEKKYNFKIIINDLSNVINDMKLNSVWKSKRYRKALFFRSVIEWIRFFNKIKKKNIIIFNFANNHYNFNSFIIKLYIKLSKKPLFLYDEPKPETKSKKNIFWFMSKLYEHNFNYKVYYFYLKNYFFYFLANFIKFEKVFTLFADYKNNINIKKKSIININEFDYSNSLLFTNKKKKKKKKYIIYLDTGYPYFAGDAHLTGNKTTSDLWSQSDMDVWHKYLTILFDKLENYFNVDVIIIPHPKYKSSNKKIKSFNPYYNNNIVNNDSDALRRLSANALFFITRFTTSVAYAVAHYKPVIAITSSKHNVSNDNKSFIDQTKSLGIAPLDMSKFNVNQIHKFLKINKSKYYDYKYKYLTTKSGAIEKKPNYKIIGDFISKHI